MELQQVHNEEYNGTDLLIEKIKEFKSKKDGYVVPFVVDAEMTMIPAYHQSDGKPGFYIFQENEFKRLKESESTIPFRCWEKKDIKICQLSNVKNNKQNLGTIFKVDDRNLFMIEHNFDYSKKSCTLYALSLVSAKVDIGKEWKAIP